MSEVRIVAPSRSIDITVPIGEGAATLPGQGLGGWVSVDRIEDVALSSWEGQTQLAQDVPIMLDGWGIHPQSVQRELDTILSLGRIGADGSPPPLFRVFGPVKYPGKFWVLPESGIELSAAEDDVITDDDGTVFRQALILHLQEYNHDAVGRKPKSKPHGQAHGGGGAVGKTQALTFTTRKDETFLRIATDLYGNWLRWEEIAKKNPKYVYSPFTKVPAGRTLNL
jgi:hypothetical protein